MLHSTDRFAPSRTLLVPLPLYLALLSACATGEELADSRGANPVSSAAQSETTTDASSGSDADAGSGEAGSSSSGPDDGQDTQDGAALAVEVQSQGLPGNPVVKVSFK